MIFVTVGNATQPFVRLLEAVDRLAGEGGFSDETVFMQTGHASAFRARHGQTQAFLTMDECLARIREARLVISHGGCGTLLQAIGLGKMPIVMPRLSRYREHVNDHQLQLVKALAAEGRIIPVYETGDLAKAVHEAGERKAAPLAPSPMRGLVENALKTLLSR